MRKRLLLSIGLFMVLATAICCGGGGDDDSHHTGICDDAAGTWNMTEDVDATDCGDGTYTEDVTYTVTQSDCDITVVPGSNPGLSFSGSVNGKKISWSGSWPEEGGTTTAKINTTIDGDSISGSSSWSWSDEMDRCTGTTQITGTRVGGGTGTASVRFSNRLTCGGNGFTATLTACGQTFTSDTSNWSPCDDITPGTCTLRVDAQTQGCGTVSISAPYTFEEGSIYQFALFLENEEAVLKVNVQNGDCSINPPLLNGVGEPEVDMEQIETVMDTFESNAGLQPMD